MASNPDNAIEQANGYVGGCQFACHFVGYGGFNYTQTNNIPLKLNSVGASLQALLSTAVIVNQFRIGIFPFIVDAIRAAPLSANFITANSVSANLANYLDQGRPMAAENFWPDVSPYMQTAGTGFSSSSTLPFIILITDGVDNNQTYSPFTGSQVQISSTTFCADAKSATFRSSIPSTSGTTRIMS